MDKDLISIILALSCVGFGAVQFFLGEVIIGLLLIIIAQLILLEIKN